MSNIAMQGGATGTGTVTLLAPSTSTNRTLTLPDATGTVALQGGTGVGKVLQVVQGTYSTETETSSSTYADTGLTASITPSSATSKILVLVTMGGVGKATNDTSVRIRTVRGATVIDNGNDIAYTASSATNFVGSFSVNILDSPATTSATTYKTQFNSQSNVAKTRICSSGSTSYITLMEIAA